MKPKKKKTSTDLFDDGDEPFSVIDVIEDRIADYRVDKNFFRPSMLFGCKRANVFHYLRAPEHQPHLDPRMQRILDNGSAVHAWVQDKYLGYSTKFWFISEPKVEITISGALLRGSCDGVLIRRSDFRKQGIEIKTKAHEMFMNLKKPDPHHVLQARVYMELQKLPYITVVYWDKDKQFMREYHVKRDRAIWKQIKSRVTSLKKFVDEYRRTKDPKKLPVFVKSECDASFCRHVKHCKRMGAPVRLPP